MVVSSAEKEPVRACDPSVRAQISVSYVSLLRPLAVCSHVQCIPWVPAFPTKESPETTRTK